MCVRTGLMCFAALVLVGAGQEFNHIYFGGVFDNTEETNGTLTDERAFTIANDLASLELESYSFRFNALTEEDYVGRSGAFKARLKTCSLIGKNALVIFGPRREEEIDVVQAVCDYKNIAHVITRWVYDPTDYRSVINFYPHSSYLTLAYFSVVTLWNWKSFTLLYEDNESLLRLGDLLNMAKNHDIVVTVKQLDEEGDGIYRRTMRDVVRSGERNFVIDCNIDNLEEVLRQAQQVGLMTSHYHYFITNLDLQTIDLHPFQYSEANITSLRIFDPTTPMATTLSRVIRKIVHPQEFDENLMRTETALLFDAVSVLAKVISNKLSFQEIETEVTCDSHQSSRYGNTISNLVKNSKNVGLTGLIDFDNNGFRSNFDLDVIEVKEEGILKIGTWNSSKGIVTYSTKIEAAEEAPDSLRNRTFRVITCLTDPYCMLKETSDQLFANDRFEGFAIDLIDELAKMEGFNYTFIIRADKANGKRDSVTGLWSGMIGDVMYGNADLAITDLTITKDREEAVDFTSPFMNLGISILAKKPEAAPPSFFSFADPFALDTWAGLAIAYVAVALSFFIMGRLCQDEWTNPYPCVEEPEFLINQFSFQNSFWFATGALMQQGTEIAPIAISTRMVSAMWWFFVLIIVSSYTASLAAFLATENTINLFSDVESLVANQEKHNIRLGAKANGATEGFFKGKDKEEYKAIAYWMGNHSEDMPTENKDGVKLAEETTYVFFMESLSIEYETQRHCNLQQYGTLLDDKGYGIAMRKNSTYRKRLSTAILKLQSSGALDKLKRKWWEEKRGGGQCLSEVDDGTTPALGVQNVEGVFYVTMGGTICAIFLVIIEMLITTLKSGKKVKVSFKEAFKIEMMSFLDFNSNTKATIQPKLKSGSKSSKESGNPNDNKSGVASYGFIPTITKEELAD